MLFRNSPEENARYSFKIDRTQTLACAIKKTQLSSPSPAVILSVSHLQGLMALPKFLFLSIFHALSHFLLQNSFTFSVTALISSPQFPFHFLPFRLQVSLTLTTSPLSASKLSLLAFLLVELGCAVVCS